MTAYVIRRALVGVAVVWSVSSLVFLLLYLLPGDPVRVMLGPRADPTIRAQITRELGLDRPAPVQYLSFLGRLAHGDLGYSYQKKQPVAEILVDRLPNTALLAFSALAISVVLGVLAGIVAALRQGRALDTLVMAGSLLGISTPVFWLGLMLILVFAARSPDGSPVVLAVLPVSGIGRGDALDTLRHLILPALSLSAIGIGYIARMTRSSLLEVVRADFMRTAHAKGLSPRRVILKHALRNAMIPVVTVIGIDLASLLGGAVATETVFSWPGLGKVLVDAIRQLDAPIVEGGVLFISVVFVAVNLAIDVSYALIDPRIRYA